MDLPSPPSDAPPPPTPTPPPPPSSQPPDTTHLTSPSPPPTTTTAKLSSPPAAALFSQDHVDNAAPDELRAMVDSLSAALRDMRLSAAHYKLQYNMAVMESHEAASRMAVELAMAHRELDVLQQADKNRRLAPPPQHASLHESANAANVIIMAEMDRHNQALQSENQQLRHLLDQQKRAAEHRDGAIASLVDENDRLKTRIRKNRDHMAPFLEHMHGHISPRSIMGTPQQPTPRHRMGRMPPPLSSDNMRGPNNFEALLLADKMLSQDTTTAPTTPMRSAHTPRGRSHQRGAISMSSLPNTPNRAYHPYARVPRTPPTHTPTAVPQSAPPAHYQQKPVHQRRQSSNSTITASSVDDDEEACTDLETDQVNESQASQMATTMLRHAPPAKPASAPQTAGSSQLIQSKIFGQVKKGHGLTRPTELDKRRLQSADQQQQQHASPTKRGRLDLGVGLGIGGLRE